MVMLLRANHLVLGDQVIQGKSSVGSDHRLRFELNPSSNARAKVHTSKHTVPKMIP